MFTRMFNYFAYGSVLSPTHAREWCASHGLDAKPFEAGVPAVLEGYRLVFDVPSRFWSGLVADLAPQAGARVEGGLFTLDDSAREAVLRKEGVATGLYRELAVTVRAGGKDVAASAFECLPARRVPEGPASSRYLDALLEGARDRALSPAWITSLEAIARDAGKPPPVGVPLKFGR